MYSLFICSAYDSVSHPHYYRAQALYEAINKISPSRAITLSARNRLEIFHRTIKVPSLWNAISTFLMYINAPRIYSQIIFKLFFSITPLDHEFDFAISSFVVALLSIIRFGKPSLIATSSGSVSAHFSGFLISLIFQIKHIRDDGDPWSFNPLPPFSYRINRILSRPLDNLILKNAFMVFVTTTNYRSLIISRLPSLDKIFFVPCGFNRTELDQPKKHFRPIKGSNKSVAIRHLGSLPRHRQFLGASDALKCFIHDYMIATAQPEASPVIQFYGNANQIFINQLCQKCDFVDVNIRLVKRNLANRLIQESDILLLAGNTSSLQIPGKLYEYLPTKALILYIQNHPDDESLVVLKKFGGFITLANDTYQSSVDEIRIQLELASARASNTALNGYEWAKISEAFYHILCNEFHQSIDR